MSAASAAIPTRLIVALLAGLSMMTSVTVDIMLPATGVIASEFGRPERLGGLIVSVYLLGFAFGQLVWGLASDAFGRRPILLLSTGVFALASLACAFAPTFEALVALRLIQGVTGGAPVVARAVTRDYGTSPAATQLMALIMATTTIGPLAGPVIGSGLIAFLGWRSCFLFLAFFAVLLWLITWRHLRETIPERAPSRFSLTFLSRTSRELLAAPVFLSGLIVLTLTFSGYASLLSLGAVVTEAVYDVPPHLFGFLFALAALFNTAGALVVRRSVARFPLERVARVAVLAIALAAFVHGAFLLIVPSLFLFWAGVCFYLFCFGLVLAAFTALALRPAGATAGFASSLLGASMMLGGFGGGALATALHLGDHRAISGVMAGFGIAALLVHVLARRRAN